MADIHATRQDFLRNRKFCAFGINITNTVLKVEDCGDAPISEDPKNKELRILWTGCIGWAPIKQLRLQSASANSYSGYYVDYADNYEEAKREAIKAARELHRKMMHAADLILAQMQATELTFVEKRCCR